MGVFCQNPVYNLEDYHNFKNVFLNNGIILEINFYYRTRGNVSFIELSEKTKKTFSSQDFDGLDEFNKLENFLYMQEVAES